MTGAWLSLQARADERFAALEREDVVLRVKAADAAKQAEELQQQLSACQVISPRSCNPSMKSDLLKGSSPHGE